MSWSRIGLRKPKGYDKLVGNYYQHEMEMGYELWANRYGDLIIGGYSDDVGLVTWYDGDESTLWWIRNDCDEVEDEHA